MPLSNSHGRGPARPRTFYVPAPIPARQTQSDAFSSTATGVGNVTGALSVKHNLATTATGVGATTSALSVKHNLSAGPAGVGRVTAGLGVSHALAASPTGVGRSTAALSVTHNLGAGGTGVGRVTVALTVVHLDSLAASLVGVGRVTGALTIQHLLNATVVAVANVSAGLSGGSISQVDGTRTGWYRRQPEPPRSAVDQLASRVICVGLLRGSLTVWSPTYTVEELAAIASLVDEDELAVLLTI